MIDVTNIILETDRLILRHFKREDLTDFHNYAKEEGVGEAAGWRHHEDIKASEKILNIFLKNKENFAIYHKEHKKVIGSIGLHSNINKTVYINYLDKKIVEIGYVLSKKYWGYGLMSEAVEKVISYLFLDLNFDYICSAYANDNVKSKKIQDKFSFKFLKKYKYINQMNEEILLNYTLLSNNRK